MSEVRNLHSCPDGPKTEYYGSDKQTFSLLQKGESLKMSTSDKPLRIDIPVELTEEKVVFSVGALAFEGDLPASPFPPSPRGERHRRVERKGAGDCDLSYECGPRDVTRRGVQCRPERVDRPIPTRGCLLTSASTTCKSSCVARRLRLTAGGTQICFAESRSTGMPWRERRSSFKKDL